MKEEIEIRYTDDGSVLIEVSIFDCEDQEIVEEAEEVRKNHWDHFYRIDPEDGEAVLMAWTPDEWDSFETLNDE